MNRITLTRKRSGRSGRRRGSQKPGTPTSPCASWACAVRGPGPGPMAASATPSPKTSAQTSGMGAPRYPEAKGKNRCIGRRPEETGLNRVHGHILKKQATTGASRYPEETGNSRCNRGVLKKQVLTGSLVVIYYHGA